jgi:glycyl-tRNA synthetase beta chain
VPELLLELLSEEIPARMQLRAAEDLKRLVTAALRDGNHAFDRAEAYVTPRRLTLVVGGLPAVQPDVVEERRGPRADAPDQAIMGFLRSGGITREQLETRRTPKGDFLFARIERKGRPTPEVLVDLLNAAIAALPWPKSMRWGSHDLRWVRPLHSILCLFDGSIVPVSFGPITAGDSTAGHRFLAPDPFVVDDFADYAAKLELAKVMLDQHKRRTFIERAASHQGHGEGLQIRPDPALLDEVTGLVEWPVVLMGRIDETFMAVPPEVLISAMRTHQKYFSLVDAEGAMAPRFIVVANTEGAGNSREIVAGNERVLRARLADAKFFWDNDRKVPLASRVDTLAGRVFHARLGSDLDRVHRLQRLARWLAPSVGAETDPAERAALLSKCDLTTDMVGEFPELQGIMGRYYALHDGEDRAVAEAIGDHYAPQGPGDRCPKAPVSIAVALADKIDTLVGFFGIGERPTGSKDPFALRRAALGAIRLIVDNDVRLRLLPLFDAATALHRKNAPPSSDAAATQGRPGWSEPHEITAWSLLDFFADRLKVYLREQGVRHDLISAVFALGGEDDLVRLLGRVDALRGFLDTDDGANLLTAYKRASNIVRIEEARDGASYEGPADQSLFSQMEEVDLHAALEGARTEIDSLLGEERFGEAMTVLASLRRPVDAFFDAVTVNCEDAKWRVNRLRLLSQIRSALTGVADFSQIEG